MTIEKLLDNLKIRDDILRTIDAGPPENPARVTQLLLSHQIPECRSYYEFMTQIGPIKYGSEDQFFCVDQAENSTHSKIVNARYSRLFGSSAWLCIARQANGYYFFVRESDGHFPSGTVFMTTPDRPLEQAMIAASSSASLARLLAKAYEHFVLEGLWELQEDPSIRSEPQSVWPFPSTATGKEPAFEIDPGLRDLDAKFPKQTCFQEINSVK